MEDFKGFCFSNYRSVGIEPVRIFPLKKMNFIIGQNNIGKSNIVKFLDEKLRDIYYDLDSKGKKLNFSDLDYHHPDGSNNDIIIGFPLELSEINQHISKIIHNDWSQHSSYNNGGPIFNLYKKVLMSPTFFKNEKKCLWFEYKYNKNSKEYVRDINLSTWTDLNLNVNDWYSMFKGLSQVNAMYQGYNLEDYISAVVKALYYKPSSIPGTVVIPAIRRIGESSGHDINYGGEGIIQQLAKLQNPQHLRQEERIKFNKINDFVRTVLERSEAQIEIPYERDMILVHMDGKVLPLDSLGTGIHEVIILAVAATILDNQIICIEEPELHLHPLLQRKLLKYIFEETNNKYIFTTHSAHLLDTVEGEIFHIYKKDQQLCINSIANKGDRTNVCKELGYKASDLLQANCIIWVEGPSDRIYMNNWIREKDNTLIEGIHYSMMFYGGRLASHLTMNDYADEVDSSTDDFISLINLNRNSAIVLDSDKSSQQSRLNDTKTRLIEEFNSNNGYVWVTSGREIENYLNADLVEKCVIEIHPKSANHLIGKGRWDNILKFEPKSRKDPNKDYTADKIAVAKLYTKSYSTDLSILDLDKKIDELIKFIKSSN